MVSLTHIIRALENANDLAQTRVRETEGDEQREYLWRREVYLRALEAIRGAEVAHTGLRDVRNQIAALQEQEVAISQLIATMYRDDPAVQMALAEYGEDDD